MKTKVFLLLLIALLGFYGCKTPPEPKPEPKPEPIKEEPKPQPAPKDDIDFDELRLMKVKINIYLINGAHKVGHVVGVNKDHITGGITELEIKGIDGKVFIILRKDIKQVSPEFMPETKK